jgi:lysozyme
MNPTILALLIAELRRDEGVKYVEYLDSKGIPTTGVGHNLQVSPLPAGWTYPLSDAQVNQLLTQDLANTFAQLNANLPWWQKLDAVRQRVIANMCFNMGIGTLLEFHNTLAAMQSGNYAAASSGMLASDWANEVGDRATRLAQAMKTGVMPDEPVTT